MADVKISALPPDATPTTDDLTIIVDSTNGETRRITLADLADLISANLTDGSVQKEDLDFASGIWWEELDRANFVSGTSISISGLPDCKHLRIIGYGIASGGVLDTIFRFNGDSGTNYATKHSVGFAASVDTASASSIAVESGSTDSGMLNTIILDIFNIQTEEKVYHLRNVSQDAAGAATLPTLLIGAGKWVNTTNYITSVSWEESGAGAFSTASELIVMGGN